MRNMTAALLLVVFAWVLVGCVGKASPEQINKMCENFGHLMATDEVPVKADLIADVERMFGQLQKDVKASHDLELKQIEEDINARIAVAKDDAEKASLQENLTAKKQQLDDKMALDLAAFEPRKAEELANVDKKIKKAVEDRDAAFKKCVEKANTEAVSADLADCRIAAKTLDKYNTVCY